MRLRLSYTATMPKEWTVITGTAVIDIDDDEMSTVTTEDLQNSVRCHLKKDNYDVPLENIYFN